jgi:predicted metal-dependent phosphoesterase TrpH
VSCLYNGDDGTFLEHRHTYLTVSITLHDEKDYLRTIRLMTYCDLHMHSTASDGTDAPEALPALALAAGVQAIALTDHDTTAGVQACARACEAAGVAFVPGIELSTNPSEVRHEPLPDGRLGTLHILGLFIDPAHPALEELHQQMLEVRQQRNPQIIENLNKLGVRISYEEVQAMAQEMGSNVIGRPHIAQMLVRKGYVKSISDAFARYIGEGKPAYARKQLLSPARAIEVIHEAGGLAALAHPVQLRCPDDASLVHVVQRLASLGLDAIETRHRDHTPAQIQRYTELAGQFNLLVTGGSDYHGSRKPDPIGCQHVPYSVYETLLAHWKQKRSA